MAFARKAAEERCPGRTCRALASASEIRHYQFNGQKYSSTDSGDVSWVTPLATLNTATWVPGTSAHTWQATAAGGMSIGTQGHGGRGEDARAHRRRSSSPSPELIAAAKAEFDKSRGPGFVYKPLVGDRKPPLDYRNNADRPRRGMSLISTGGTR